MGKSWSVSLFVFLVLACGQVQAATYAYRNQAFSYDTPSAGATAVAWHGSGASPACTGYPDGDDDWADVSFPGGFVFTFGGTNYSGVRIYSNGILAFGNDISGFHRTFTPQILPITGQASAGPFGCPRGVPARLMLPYWIDIVAGTANSTTGASVRYELLGTAPNRRFVISWVNVKLYNTNTRYNFQVVQYESVAGVNGNFEYRYTSGSSTGANATVGVQLTTTDYTQYSYNQQFIDTTNGTSILWYPANQLATKGAEYRFDESVWTGVAGEVKDTSGNSQDGQRVGNASSTAGGKLCRGGSFTNNASNNVIDAMATPVVPGNTGSVSFWYRSTNNWNSADTMLFDATAVANRTFFLMKRNNGRLRFAVSDSSGTTVTAETGNLSYAANTWQHIGVTWSVRAGTNQTHLQIFINGSLVRSERGTTNGTVPALSSIYLGDNRTTGVTPNNGTPNGANGTIDEFYVYSLDVSGPQFEADMNLTRPVCTVLDHFRIIHDGTASCGTAQITVEAHDLNHALFSLAGSTMTLSTSTGHGAWSVVNAINPVINTTPGNATYTFANESRVVFALSNPYVETLNINVASGSITERTGTGSTCTAADYTYGTVCDADLVFAPCLSQFNACHDHATSQCRANGRLHTRLASTPFTTDVVALDASGNPAGNFSGKAVVSLIARAVPGSVDAQNCFVPDYSQVLDNATIAFASGRLTVNATVPGAWRDARIRVVCDSTNCPPSGITGCSVDNLAIRPGVVTIPWGWATPPSATATPTLSAGTTFLVSAITSTAPTDNYAGTLSLDTSKLTAQNTSQDTTIQSGGAVGTLTVNPQLIVNESPSTGRATYTEVGYLYLAPGALRDDSFTAVDQGFGDCIAYNPLDPLNHDWLAASAVGGKFGCSIGNASTVSFGRFSPYAFDTTVTHACGNFTYSGQPFPLKVTAINYSGGTTTNYTGKFANTLAFQDANGATGAFTPATLSATSFVDGVADLTVTPSVSFAFTDKLTEPKTLKVRVLKSGGENSMLGNEGTTLLRSGRLRLFNAYGSVSPLKMRVEAQYWSGKSWVKNTDDSCTTTTGATPVVTFNSPDGVTFTPKPFANGEMSLGGMELQRNTTGPATINANVPDWLKAPDGSDPTAKATFGIYGTKESRKTIHIRELY